MTSRRALFEEMKARIKETDLSVPFRKGGRWFYSRTEEGQQYPILCRTDLEPPPGCPRTSRCPASRCCSTSTGWRATATTSRWAPTTSRPARTCSSTRPTTTAPRSTRCGSATFAPAIDLDDVIPETTYGSAWAGDDTFFYVRPGPHHAALPGVAPPRSARPPTDDVLVYEDADERFFVSVGLSLTEQWVHITSSSKVTSEEHLDPGRRSHRRRRPSCSPASRAWSTTSPTRPARSTATASSSSPTSTAPSTSSS